MGTASKLNFGEFEVLVHEVKAIAQDAVENGTAIHVVEKQLLEKLLQVGHAALSAMFQSVGNGDVGELLQPPGQNTPWKRYPELSTRIYRSVFGNFVLSRYLYGKAPSLKAQAIPFDEHFGLPANRFSLLLESWVAQLSTSEAIHEAMDKLNNILGIKIAVDSAERILARTGTDNLNGEVSAIGWLAEHVDERRQNDQELVNLNDGERSIWDNVEMAQEHNGRVDIVDLMHGIQRVWDAAAILKPVDVIAFAKGHIRTILHGNVKSVIQGFRWNSTHMELEGKALQGMKTKTKHGRQKQNMEDKNKSWIYFCP